jgi:hypothetical protein
MGIKYKILIWKYIKTVYYLWVVELWWMTCPSCHTVWCYLQTSRYMFIGHLVWKSSCGVLIRIATYLLYGVHVVNGFATCIVAPIMYLLVLLGLMYGLWCVRCGLWSCTSITISAVSSLSSCQCCNIKRLWVSRLCLSVIHVVSVFRVKVSRVHRLCGLVVRVPGYGSKASGSIPGATTFSENQWVWNGVHSASWVQLRSYLEENVMAPV